jgi:calcineurin-like phosphoesterase family protein
MIYFSSDHHFWHTNIIRFCNRPYASIEEMNEMLILNWNNTVKPDDIVYYLGDFSLATRPVETVTPRLNGKKFLVPGNHDWAHSYHKKGKKDLAKWKAFYESNGWEVLDEQTHIYALSDTHGIHKLNLCHFPKVFEFYDDKYENWRPEPPEDEILLCGHVHQSWKQRGSCINVGVDVWEMKPVSISQIFDLINPT